VFDAAAASGALVAPLILAGLVRVAIDLEEVRVVPLEGTSLQLDVCR
jgi:hypothetical protein